MNYLALTGLLAQALTLFDPSFIGRTRSVAAAGCDTLKDSNTGTSGHTDMVIGQQSANAYRATKFTPSASYSACKIELLLGKDGANGTPTGNIYAYIYSDSGSAPSTLLATSDAIDSSTLATKGSSNYVAFTFASPASLTSGTVYWIALGKTVNLDLNSWVGWWGPDTFVANGNMISSDGSTWAAGNSRRLNFKTYAQ